MLGSVKQTWNWIGSGKHPAAGDYFKVGQFTPVLDAVAGWLENGFGRLVEARKKASDSPYSQNSWRFWIRGSKAGHMVVGVVKDSSDSLGRPYPLLIAGTGPLKNCEAHWELLPFACEKIWAQMEYLGTGQYDGVEQIEERVAHIYPPAGDCLKTGSQGETAAGQPGVEEPPRGLVDIRRIEDLIASLVHMPEFVVPMDLDRVDDPLQAAGMLHKVLKKVLPALPNALFMGGAPDRACLAVFQRPLSPQDVTRLWSARERIGPDRIINA